MGICASKKNKKKKGKDGKHKKENPFKSNQGHKGSSDPKKGEEHHDERTVEEHHEDEAVVVEKPGMDLVDTIHASHAHEVREEGWVDMKNERLYGKDHQYFHEKFTTLEAFSTVRFGDANTAWQYLAEFSKHKRNPQGVHFDMERNCKSDHLKCYPAIIDEKHDLRELRLSFYENHHLDFDQFKVFMQSVSKLKRLKKLDVNLRWCKNVRDDWLHVVG